MVGRICFLLLLAMAGVTYAAPAPDLTPVRCAWASFTTQQQQALRNSVAIDNSKADAVYYKHDRPTQHETAKAATTCKLEYTAAQLNDLSQALGYKAREEVARMGLAARGVIRAHIVDRAVDNMDEERRAEIGTTFACPNARMDGAWDRSLISAIRRTGTKAVDGPSVAYVGMAMYAIMAQEGFVRRILGTNPPCPPPQ